jgi:N-acetyl-alpha-D-muramate 1-phosphate uridylyltransferase
MTDSVSGNRPDRNAPNSTPLAVGVVLAAGEGRRLRPLTDLRPKALCPVGGVALVDLALDRVRVAVEEVAVNVHHGRDQLVEHLARAPSVHLSIEEPRALGTAGALGALRPWIAGRAVLVHNADAWCQADLAAFVAGWDGQRVRVLLSGAEPAGFGPRVGLVASLVPWTEVARLGASPAGLYETTLAPAAGEGRLEVVAHDGPFVDCGTPARYLAANLAAVEAHRAAGGGDSIVDPRARIDGAVVASVVGAAQVDGRVERSVIWDGARVAAGESVSRVVRAPGLRPDVDCR